MNELLCTELFQRLIIASQTPVTTMLSVLETKQTMGSYVIVVKDTKDLSVMVSKVTTTSFKKNIYPYDLEPMAYGIN